MSAFLLLTAVLFCAFPSAWADAVHPHGAGGSQPQIAVYVTGGVSENEKRALGTAMLASLVNSGRYSGIERSDEFTAEIGSEHARLNSVEIDDKRISELGRQYGVEFICVANITPLRDGFLVSARIINVETAEAVFTGGSSGSLQTMRDIASLSDTVVGAMLGTTEPKKKTNERRRRRS
ncbi:MAG: hypothetical protein LBC70_06695 [Chitinispirillales bacterium]|nr:hypothetical protein [Chitinispirillales bacterium]